MNNKNNTKWNLIVLSLNDTNKISKTGKTKNLYQFIEGQKQSMNFNK